MTAKRIGKNLLLALAVYFLIGGVIWLHTGPEEETCAYALGLAVPLIDNGLLEAKRVWSFEISDSGCTS